MKSNIISQHILWEENILFYATEKGRFYEMHLTTRKTRRISASSYQIWLDIYYNA